MTWSVFSQAVRDRREGELDYVKGQFGALRTVGDAVQPRGVHWRRDDARSRAAFRKEVCKVESGRPWG